MEKTIEFLVDETTVRGKLFTPKGSGPFPGVVFFHGSGGVGDMHFENAKKLSEHGFITLAINYRGVGLSEGEFEEQTIQDGIEDGEKALEFFLSLPEVDKLRVGLCGGSFGGFIAALLCDQFPIKSLILEAPASYSPEISKNTHRDLEDELRRDNFLASVSYNEIEKYKGVLLLVQSEFDDVLPKGMVEEYDKRAVNAASKELFILKQAKHRISIDLKNREVFQKKLIEFFKNTL